MGRGYVLFKLNGQRGFSIKVTTEQRVEWGEVSPEDFWRKSNPAEMAAHAKVLRWDCVWHRQITAHGNMEPKE